MALLLFLAGFVATVLLLPARPPDDSMVVGWASRSYRWAEGIAMGSRAKPTVTIGPRRVFSWVYVRVEEGVAHDVALEELSGDQQMETLRAFAGSTFIRVGYVHEVHRKGLWFPWLERWLVTVTPENILDRHAAIDPAALNAALDRAALQVLPTNPQLARGISRRGDSGSRVLWGRIALNALSLVLLVLCAHAVVTRRQWRSQRRWKSGRCPGCAYPLAGVPIHDEHRVCPECGISARAGEAGGVGKE